MPIEFIASYPLTIFKRLPYLALCLLLCCNATAQVQFFFNESTAVVNKARVLAFADTSANMSIERYAAIKAQMQPLNSRSFNLSYKNQMLWLYIPMNAVQDHASFTNIMLRNPHLNNLHVWIFKEDSLLKAFEPTGDHLLFSTRTLRYADFVFPIPAQDRSKLSFLVLLDKRNEHCYRRRSFIIQPQEKLTVGFNVGYWFVSFSFQLLPVLCHAGKTVCVLQPVCFYGVLLHFQ
ncbi:MAG: hypothetical protein GXC73_10255 [Chitinophagaceae bacterium]|nr:hypothetical protein [Chitinophagaceae bacterium]